MLVDSVINMVAVAVVVVVGDSSTEERLQVVKAGEAAAEVTMA